MKSARTLLTMDGRYNSIGQTPEAVADVTVTKSSLAAMKKTHTKSHTQSLLQVSNVQFQGKRGFYSKNFETMAK